MKEVFASIIQVYSQLLILFGLCVASLMALEIQRVTNPHTEIY